jgi:hypothetical protein
MANIGLQEYFALSELIEKKDPRICNFDKTLKDVNNLKRLISEVEIKNLSPYVKSYNRIRFFLWTITFILVFLYTIMHFGDDINISTFLVFSVFIPFVIFIGSLFLYTFRVKKTYFEIPLIEDVGSFVRFVLGSYSSSKKSWPFLLFRDILSYLKRDVKYDKRHNRVLQAYSFRLIQEVVIVYSLSLLLLREASNWLIFSRASFNAFNEVEAPYYSLIETVSSFWSWFTAWGIPSRDLIHATCTTNLNTIEQGSQAPWGHFLLMAVLFWVIIPKIVLWMLVKITTINKAIKISLKEQLEKCLEDQNRIDQTVSITVENQVGSEKKSSNESFILYYGCPPTFRFFRTSPLKLA